MTPQNQSPRKLRLALVADGPPTDRHTNSGVAYGMLEALTAHPRVDQVVPIDAGFRGVRKALVALGAAKPSGSGWRVRYSQGRLSVRIRSQFVEQQVRRLSPAIDFVILIRGLYQPLKSPYVAFIDSTVKLNGSSWPPLAHRGGDYAWSVRADTAQLRGAVHVFTAGRHVAEHVVRAYGIPEDHVTAIGGGLNYPLSEVPTRAPSSVPTILFVGHDFQRKGGDVLVDAFTRVRRAIPDARLLLVGRGARLHGRGAGITSLGEVEDRRELSELYRQATVFCLPARFEPFGLVLLEAMAHGVPCVATRVGEIPQILQDGRLGRLVDREDPEALAETLLDLLGDPELQRTLSERARGHVQACRRWDLVADQMVQRLTIERQ